MRKYAINETVFSMRVSRSAAIISAGRVYVIMLRKNFFNGDILITANKARCKNVSIDRNEK